MYSESTGSGSEPQVSSPAARQATDHDCQFDRRAIIRGAGAVLLAGSLAGCYHEGEDGGGDDEGDGGGGDYSVDAPAQER